ncbi:GNVR domain-containing protein [Marinitoga sp. 1138]|uniref:GumC family protein n=1 Tax=Marinitoga sp. 1138 TaxID=1643334 RepID=UPI0015862F5C|nr:GNVR domain-containing protein [Marinitoga sp. 1138]NUU97757.1 hypothetical protein [Marinitoga sp. 1138]
MEPEMYEDELTLSDILRIFKRRKITFFVILILTILLTGLYLLKTPATYEASLTFEMKDVSSTSSLLSQYGSLASMVGINLGGSKGNSISNTIEKMKSDKILTAVIEKNNLVELYNSEKSPSFIDKLLNRNKEIKLRDIIEKLREDISIQQQKDTSFIKISYKSTKPTLAASIVKSIYTEYLKYDKEEYLNDSEYYLSNLKKLFGPVEKKYMEIQKKLLDFQVNNKIFDEQSFEPYIDKYSQLYFSLIEIESQKKELEAAIKSVEDSISALNPDMKKFFLENNGNIGSLKNQLVSLKIEYETLKLTSSQNPKLLELESKIKVIEENLKAQMNDILNNNLKFLASTDPDAYKQYVSNKIKLELLDVMKASTVAVLNKIDADIKEKSPLLYEYFQLKKDSKILQEKYERLKASIETEEFKKNFYKPSLSIINDVYIPYKPVAPNKKLTLAIGIVLGFFLGILGVFIKDYNDKRIKDCSELSRILKSPEFIITRKNRRNEIKKLANYIYVKGYHNKTLGFTAVDYNEFLDIVEEVKLDLSQLVNKRDLRINILPDIDNPDFILHEDDVDYTFVFIYREKSTLENIEKYKDYLKNNYIVFVE